MTIIVLNRRKVVPQIADWLQNVTEPLILITAKNVFLEAPTDVVKHFTKVVLVDDYNSQEVEDAIVEIAASTDISRIISSAEVDVIRAAQLRERLGIKGQSIDAALAYRDKFKMKSILNAAGIRIARMVEVTCPDDITSFAGTCGYPVVLKPRGGGGAVGIHILKTAAEVRSACEALSFKGPGPDGWMAETWVQGRFLTVDGLMQDGIVRNIWPSFTTANFDAVSGKSLLKSTMLGSTSPEKHAVSVFVAQAIAALPAIKEVTAFHAEVFLDENGEMTLCEIACRPGGCGHVPVFERAFGLNLYAESLKGQTGMNRADLEHFGTPETLAGFVWIPPQKGTLVHLPTVCPIPGVTEFKPMVAEQENFEDPHSVADHVVQVFLEGRSEIELLQTANDVERWWHATSVWVSKPA